MGIIADHKAKWAKANKARQSLRLGGAASAPEPKALAAAVASAVGSDTDEKRLTIEKTVLSETIKADVSSLKTAYPEHPARNAATPPYLDKYREYCDEALQRADAETHDPILVQCAIWAINCAEFGFATQLVDHCKGMNSGMKRTLPELIADMVLQDERANDDDRLAVLNRIDAETWVVNHPLMAKLYKFGAIHFEKSDLAVAVDYAVKAHETYANVGVKTLMETLQKRLLAQSGE